ncbi:MAG: hypothetical protein ABIC40_01475 [bacterium]
MSEKSETEINGQGNFPKIPSAGQLEFGILIGIFFAVLYFVFGFILHSYGFLEVLDVFCESDSARVMCDMTMFNADHTRTNAHPIFTIMFNPAGVVLSKIVQSKPIAALIINSLFGGLCVTLIFIFFLQMGVGSALAGLSAMALGFSSAHLFFGSSPETHLYSAASLIILTLLVKNKRGSLKHFIPAGIFSFGLLITNIIPVSIFYGSGIWKGHINKNFIVRLVAFAAIVLLSVTILAAIQQKIYPTSNPFYIRTELNNDFDRTTAPSDLADIGTRIGNLATYMLIADFIAPEIKVTSYDKASRPIIYTNTKSPKPLYVIGAILMIVLNLAAFYSLLKNKSYRDPIIRAFLLVMCFNVVLYFFYSNEILFIFTCNWTFIMLSLIVLSINREIKNGKILPVVFMVLMILLVFIEMTKNTSFVLSVIDEYRDYWLKSGAV